MPCPSSQIHCLGSLQEILPKKALRQMPVHSVCTLTRQKMSINIPFPTQSLRLVAYSICTCGEQVCAHTLGVIN